MFFVIYTWKKVDYKKYGLFRFTRVDFRMPGQILSVSIWVMIQHGSLWGMVYLLYRQEHLGERPLAITNVVRSISSFLFMFVNAFASTNSSLVSNLIGAGESDRVLPLPEDDRAMLCVRATDRYLDRYVPVYRIAYGHG